MACRTARKALDIPEPTADNDQIRELVIASLQKNEWRPAPVGVIVRDGIVHLSGIITDERVRQAIVAAAENVPDVKLVHDHLYLFDAMSELSFRSPEDEDGKGRLARVVALIRISSFEYFKAIEKRPLVRTLNDLRQAIKTGGFREISGFVPVI